MPVQLLSFEAVVTQSFFFISIGISSQILVMPNFNVRLQMILTLHVRHEN